MRYLPFTEAIPRKVLTILIDFGFYDEFENETSSLTKPVQFPIKLLHRVDINNSYSYFLLV